MNTKNKIKVAFTGDGSFLPIRNGAYYSIYHLMRALWKTKQVQPILSFCYRGWDDPKLYFRQPFHTIFLKPEDYYHDTGIMNYAFNVFDIQIVQILNAEEILNQGRRLQRTCVRVIYEVANVDHVLYRRLGANHNEIKKIKAVQTEACQTADHVLCRSEVDQEHLIQMGVNPDKITIYTGAIDVKGIRFEPRKKKRFKVVFLGHMYYPPNENALKLIANQVLLKLQKLDKRYTLTVIGIAPKSMVEEYGRQGIIFTGGVDDLSRELLKYDIAIAPLYKGSGTRLKLLDQLASGMLTITTTLGIEGLKPEINQHLIIEDDIQQYAECIHHITLRLAKYENMMYNGRRFVEANYDWSQCLDPFLQVYKQLI